MATNLTRRSSRLLALGAPGDLVFDPMCGSGTTLKMALKHRRRYLGIEISPEYVMIARKRLKSLQLTLEGY